MSEKEEEEKKYLLLLQFVKQNWKIFHYLKVNSLPSNLLLALAFLFLSPIHSKMEEREKEERENGG